MTTTKIRVSTNGAVDNGYSRITEVEAWGTDSGSGGSSANINWLVTDQLGTPRMVFDKSGSFASTKRHDYLPFGEELVAPQGLRSTALGYTADLIRQKFTQKERDNETTLDYFGARYYSSTQGRFISIDPLLSSGERNDPQTWNRYAYVTNSPLIFNDPTGERRNPVTGRRGIDPVPKTGTHGGIRSNSKNPHVGEWGMTRSNGRKGHFGTDITAPSGTNLVAMEGGQVDKVRNTKIGGLEVNVKMADGTVYKYFHLSAIPTGIKQGVQVQEGQVIAVSGNSGNAQGYAGTNEEHVHVTVRDANGANVNPVVWLNDPNAGVPVDVVSTTGTPPATPLTVPAGSPNQQTVTGPNGTVTVQQQPLPAGQPHSHKPPR